MQRTNHQMKTARVSKVEKRAGDIASRRARRQLMRVPWDRFHKAYEEYIRWQAFVLWARAVVESEGCAPLWLQAILRKRCPGLAKETVRSNNPELLDLQLLSWVHNQAFDFAKGEGWLDALVFYGFRDTRSQGYWAYWEYCENEWKRVPPKSFPTFMEWWRSALNWKLQGDVRCAAIAKAVEKYLDFEALAYWLCPFVRGARVQLPPHVALELRQESPSLLEFVSRETSAAYKDQSRSWRRLFNWGKGHVLSHAKKEGWVDCVLRQARFHPFHVRLVDYTAFYCRSRVGNTALPYPSLRQWSERLESYVRTNQG